MLGMAAQPAAYYGHPPAHHATAAALPPPPPPPPAPPLVRTVWACNLDAETHLLRQVAARARCVAFAVHYPGVVHAAPAAPAGADHNTLTAAQRYAAVKANVDALKPLQVGLAVGTHDGLLFAWEFNLRGFDRATDPHAAASVEYLQRERGMDLDAHRAHGVPAARLTDALHRSGLLRRRDLTWLAYAGAYHAAYLLKVVRGGLPLPGDVPGFLAAVRRFLGDDVFDVACVAGACQALPVGLERVAGRLGLASPLGSPDLAGASAALALQAFFSQQIHTVFLRDVNRFRGILQGLQVS